MIKASFCTEYLNSLEANLLVRDSLYHSNWNDVGKRCSIVKQTVAIMGSECVPMIRARTNAHTGISLESLNRLSCISRSTAHLGQTSILIIPRVNMLRNIMRYHHSGTVTRQT